MSRNPEVLRDSPPEQRSGVKSFLNRHKGKLLLTLGLLGAAGAGAYTLGGAAIKGTVYNMPSFLGERGAKLGWGLTANAARFRYAIDGMRNLAPDAATQKSVVDQLRAGTIPT
jgi:hypothetical protein